MVQLQETLHPVGEDACCLPVASMSSLKIQPNYSPHGWFFWKSSLPLLPALNIDFCRSHSHPDPDAHHALLTPALLKHLPLVLRSLRSLLPITDIPNAGIKSMLVSLLSAQQHHLHACSWQRPVSLMNTFSLNPQHW